MKEFYDFLTKGILSLPFYNHFSNTPEAINDAVKTNENESSNNLDKNTGDISFAAEAITSFGSTDSVTVTPQTSLMKILPPSFKSIQMQKASNFDESKNNLLENTLDSVGTCSLSGEAFDNEEARLPKDSTNGVETCAESAKTAVEGFEFSDGVYWEDDLRIYLYPEDDDSMPLPTHDTSSGDINNVSFLHVNQ
uniref:Uncharacterized protein n=1 Tax=Panagrolaimus davidi TaxID=227884 RepID=A0A914QQ50_9BILA